MTDLPQWWSHGSFTAKAGWLAASGRAKSFTEACSMLAKMRSRKKPTPVQAAVAEKNYWWNKENKD